MQFAPMLHDAAQIVEVHRDEEYEVDEVNEVYFHAVVCVQIQTIKLHYGVLK